MTVSGVVRSVGWILALVVSIVIGAAALAAAQSRQGPAAQAPDRPPVVIKELVVEGNRRVQEAVIVGAIKSKLGGPFNPSQLTEDVRAIFGLGFFDDVQMKVEDFEGGVKVAFVVTERPFVRDVDFAGNRKIGTDTLREKIDLKLGNVYNPVEVQRARERLKDHYEDEGYYEVEITPDVERFADGDVRVTFSVNEGRRMTIDRIAIHGNRGLTDREIKSAMATKERQYFILRGTVQRQRLEDDIERVIAFYNDHGYIQARVESHEVAVDRERARVTIHINVVEGPQYRVGDVGLTGVTLLPEPEIRRQLKFKTGDVFSRSELRETMRAITDLYSTIGRASADVLPRTEQDPVNQRMNVVLEITEGPEVYVERINVTGNVRSQDKILRREIPMVEGDLFTLQKLQRARQRLVNLGYFETVNATTQPGSDKTRIIVNVDVTERPTGMFALGGGFSSVDSFLGTIDLSQRNFLGRGWEVALRARAGGRTQQGSLSFTEPWLFDTPLSAGFDLFNLRRQFSEYDIDSLGGHLRLSHPFADYARWHVGYRLTRDEITDLSDDVSQALRDEEGARVTSMITMAVSRDSRDNLAAPTKGWSSSIALDVAGLGGDSRYVKTVASTTWFKPIWLNHIVSARGEVGYGFGWGDDPLPLFERFYLGGPNSVRGVKFRRISPVDESGTRIGGTSEVLANAEYIIPLPLQIRLAAFFDIGNVYGFGTKFDPTDTREAAGAGVRWNSPFGPIRVDYGVNLDRRSGEDFGAFHFSVGSPF
jgi:outer membrane protein insertion porin family